MVDRLIQGPDDVTHCIAGPWLKPLVKKLKQLWGPSSMIHYGSCKPDSLRTFLRERLVADSGFFFWSDFSMFDCTHSADSWAFMERLYKRAGIDEPDFWKVMDAWRQPSGLIGPFKYKANIMNASGRDDTSLANGVLNGFCSFLSAAAAWLQKDVLALTKADLHTVSGLLSLSVCGDDSIGRLPSLTASESEAFAFAFRKNVAMFGFEAKLGYSDRLVDAVYLGHRPLPVAGQWLWGKTIGRATYKMGWLVDDGSRDPLAHITGVADMHVRCSKHVPVLYDLASKIVELRQGAKRTPYVYDPNKPWQEPDESGAMYDDATLKAVAEAYTTRPCCGTPAAVDQEVTVADVKSLISAIRGIKRLPCVLDHWLWKRMVAADDL
jgi:hypothetical protein